MRQKRTVLPLLLVATILFLLPGFSCNHKAATISHGVAASINDLQQAEISLYNTGKITADEHLLLEQGFKSIAQEDIAVRKCIATTNAPGCVDAGIDVVNNFVNSNANGIKNPQSKQQVQLLAQAIITALNTLKAAL